MLAPLRGDAAAGGHRAAVFRARRKRRRSTSAPARCCIDPARGEPRRTWCFVMTLCFSRHQYVEFVWDQTVATWLGCHRRAFEWFGARARAR